MFSCPQVSTVHRSLFHNDYFMNCFRLEPRKCSGWSRTKLQVMFPVVGTHPYNSLCYITSKVFHPFKNIYELENFCPYLLQWCKSLIAAVGRGASCGENETFGYTLENKVLHLMFSSAFLVLHKGHSNAI